MLCIFCLHLFLQIYLILFKMLYGPVTGRCISLRDFSSFYMSTRDLNLGPVFAQQALLLFEPPPQAYTIAF